MIYFDSAATTMEKPSSVPRACAWAMTHMSSPGRGGHRAGMRAAETAYLCRETAARLFHLPDPERVVLTSNATHGLNLAIHSLVKPGGVVLISGYEHNAVTRPLCARSDLRIKIAAAPVFESEEVLRAFQREMTEEVDLVICNHVSNVFGFIQPLEQIAALCRDRRKPLIADVSQSAGSLPVSMEALGAAFLAMPGHKGLYGPQGTGLLLCGTDPKPLLFGGTGSNSTRQDMPDFLPDRMEAGTQNICGAAGLLAGMRFVERKGIRRIQAHECALCRRMMDALESIPGVQVFRGKGNQSGLCSFLIRGMDCEETAAELGKHGVAVRAGLHCAPLAHRTAGTFETGTVRLSFSAFNCAPQVDRAAELIEHIAQKGRTR